MHAYKGVLCKSVWHSWYNGICKQMKELRATYTTTKPIAFTVTKSSSKDSAALSANTQCFKSRPVRKTVNNQHCQWSVTKTLSDPSHRSKMYMYLLCCNACYTFSHLVLHSKLKKKVYRVKKKNLCADVMEEKHL